MTASFRKFLIVGLGNMPFPNTRHSIGHLVIDSLAKKLGIERLTTERYGLARETTYVPPDWPDGRPPQLTLTLMKPKALMNICGPQVAAALHGGSSTLIVIHDSLEHKPLTLSPKFGGSAGGHNGVRSIISALGNDSQFHRLRIGIGRGEGDVSGYVLGKLDEESRAYWGPGGEGVEVVWREVERIVRETRLGKRMDGSVRKTPKQRRDGKESSAKEAGRCVYCGSAEHSFREHPGESGVYLSRNKNGTWSTPEGRAVCIQHNKLQGCAVPGTCPFLHVCSLCGSSGHSAQTCEGQ